MGGELMTPNLRCCLDLAARFQTAPDQLLQRDFRGSETGQSTTQSNSQENSGRN